MDENGPRPTPGAATAELFGTWSVTQSIDIDREAASAWQLLTDVSRIGEFSPACVSATWLDDPPRRVGSRFEGTNLTTAKDSEGRYEFEWTRPCVVSAWDPPSRFACTVADRYDGTPATEWDFLIEANLRGCRMIQTFRHLKDGLSRPRHWADADPANGTRIVAARTAGLEEGMRTTLRAMKSVLERE